MKCSNELKIVITNSLERLTATFYYPFFSLNFHIIRNISNVDNLKRWKCAIYLRDTFAFFMAFFVIYGMSYVNQIIKCTNIFQARLVFMVPSTTFQCL